MGRKEREAGAERPALGAAGKQRSAPSWLFAEETTETRKRAAFASRSLHSGGAAAGRTPGHVPASLRTRSHSAGEPQLILVCQCPTP